MAVESLADLVEPYRRAARARRRTRHTVFATQISSACRPDSLPPALAHRGDAFHDTIEAVESEGWRLEHVSAEASGHVLLVFRAT
jgi:hypothetical protein